MATHTPGPWDQDEYEDADREIPLDSVMLGDVGVFQSESGISIANMWQGNDAGQTIDFETARANARLIAAAPDLLSAAKAAIPQMAFPILPDDADDAIVEAVKASSARIDDALSLLRAAVAKAEGRS